MYDKPAYAIKHQRPILRFRVKAPGAALMHCIVGHDEQAGVQEAAEQNQRNHHSKLCLLNGKAKADHK